MPITHALRVDADQRRGLLRIAAATSHGFTASLVGGFRGLHQPRQRLQQRRGHVAVLGAHTVLAVVQYDPGNISRVLV